MKHGMLVIRNNTPAVAQYVPFGEWPLTAAGDVSPGGGEGCHAAVTQQRLATMLLGAPPSSAAAAHADDDDGAARAAAHVGGGAFLQVAPGPSPGMEATGTVPPPVATSSWFMDSSCYDVLPSSPAAHANTAAAAAAVGASDCNVVNSGGGDNATSRNSSNCCGPGSAIPPWGDMSTFAMLP
ncbi:Dof zinc finger protein DOF5.7 [Zea mays]|nr:Dof zinc finger protein DOF5.7 [Zea mays]